jgi:hypothetical protein
MRKRKLRNNEEQQMDVRNNREYEAITKEVDSKN